MLHSEKLYFIKHTVPDLLLQLSPNTMGKWGVLNAQQMIEHLSESVQMANGKIKTELLTPEEHLEKLRTFMLSDKPFKENTKNALMSSEPLPPKHKGMNEAVEELRQEIQDFIVYFESSHEKKVINPFFGALNFEEYTHLLHKHFKHHCQQFNLLQ